MPPPRFTYEVLRSGDRVREADAARSGHTDHPDLRSIELLPVLNLKTAMAPRLDLPAKMLAITAEVIE